MRKLGGIRVGVRLSAHHGDLFALGMSRPMQFRAKGWKRFCTLGLDVRNWLAKHEYCAEKAYETAWKTRLQQPSGFTLRLKPEKAILKSIGARVY